MVGEKKKTKTIGKVAIGVGALLIIIIAAVWIVVSGKLNLIGRITNGNKVDPGNIVIEPDDPSEQRGEKISSEDVEINIDDIKLMTDSDVINILFIGSDARVIGENDRSDSMIICSLNKKTSEIKLVSLLRDMYVKIPGYKNNRINASYAFGGVSLLNETIETNFGIKINGNVAVNFDGFIEALSQIGSLEIEVSKEEADYMNAEYGWKVSEGINTFSPEQVLYYSRIRHVGRSDWDRTERQRKVIMTAFEKVKDLSIGEMLSLANKIFPCIATDMDNWMIINLVRLVFAAKMRITETARVPIGEDSWEYKTIDEMGVILPNVKLNAQRLQEILYGTTETADSN